mgnify:CR=1 FL=1
MQISGGAFSQNPLVNCVELSIESEMFTLRTLRAGSLCSQINNFIENLSETTSDYPWKEDNEGDFRLQARPWK